MYSRSFSAFRESYVGKGYNFNSSAALQFISIMFIKSLKTKSTKTFKYSRQLLAFVACIAVIKQSIDLN